MKPILFTFCLSSIFCPCTEYQYLTLSGSNISKTEKNEFVAENDTMKIQYHFQDYKGKVGISILNKSGQPLEVDWKKSALIVRGEAVSYFNPSALIAATLERDSTRLQSGIINYDDPRYLASLNGSVFIDQPTQFIPPSAFIYKVPLVLPLEPFQNLPVAEMKKASMAGEGDLKTSFNRLSFERSTSPLQFKSYLTVRIGATGSQKEFTVEHSFYVSEIWKTTSAPSLFPADSINRGDRFYL